MRNTGNNPITADNMDFRIPDSAVKYILFQRTAHLVFADMLPFRAARKFTPFFSYEAMVAMEARLRPRSIKKKYLAQMRREYDSIAPHLPAGCNRILDIGCGVAGIDLFLNAHYGAEAPVFFLLDKTRLEQKVHYMFEARGAFYNSLDVAGDLLASNGIASHKIRLLEAADNGAIAIEAGIDLALSLISWGFHYPVDVYLDQVHQLLGPGGVLIMDIRKETDGLDRLAAKFGGYQIVCDTSKYQRICALKQ